MLGLYLTPQALPVLVQPLLTGCLAVYFLRLPEKSRATWLLTAMFANGTLYSLCNVFLYTTLGVAKSYFADLLLVFAQPGVLLLVAFAYAFLGNIHPRESKVFLWVAGLLVGSSVGVLLVRLVVQGPEATEPGLVYELQGLVLVVWALVLFIRKARLPGKAGRAHRALAGLFCLLLLAQLTSLLALFGLISLGFHYLIADLAFLLLYAGFAFVYLNHAPHPTSFQVKLVGLSLFTVLTVLSIVSLFAFQEEALLQESGVRLKGRTSLRFEPTSEGYRVMQVPFAFDPQYGERLRVEDEPASRALGFAFPFFGELRQQFFIFRDAALAFGDRLPELPRTLQHELPLLAPLRIDLRETEEGGVYFKHAPDQATITWHNLSQQRRENRNTVQVVLEADGAIQFNYDRVEAVIAEGLRGVFPGGSVSALHQPGRGLVDQGTGPVLVEDFAYAYRRRVHRRMLPVAYGLFGATAFILLVFPLFFRASLVEPLNRLLGGVRRINAGDLDTTVPVGVRDEVGRLTEHFNQMTHSLQQAHHDLREYAEHLEEMVGERTTQIAHQNEQLAVQAERLRELDEAKTRFFANISHELRTPLTLIVGPLSRLSAEPNDALDPDVREQFGMMLRNGQRLQRLINQILDLTKLEAGGLQLDRRPHDLVDFIRRHVRLYETHAQYEEVVLTFQARVPMCLVSFDEVQMEKVLANLLSNALKFTGAGGRVSVTVEAEAEAVAIHVEDSGVGIPAEKLAHVFDRFFQVEDTATRTYEGTGIGLALVKELVELHGGTVGVTSKPGCGSTFTVLLPYRGMERASSEGASSPHQEARVAYAQASSGDPGVPATGLGLSAATLPSQKPEGTRSAVPTIARFDRTTVLVVEDNADMRAYIRSVLEPAYRVLEASDGEKGLHLAQTTLPDLILADVMMPRMDGLAMSRCLRDDPTTGSIPIVLLTARAAVDDRVEGLGTGADAYLVKPFHEEVLLLQVGNLITKQHRLRERLRQEPTAQEAQVASKPAFEAQVCAVIEKHLSDPQFSVEALAEEVAMSRQHLYRRMRDETGATPVAFIRQFRLERAAQLLREGEGNVSEVAYAVGFNSLSYFSRCFHEHFEVTPSAFLDGTV